jgi:hypothetical protein
MPRYIAIPLGLLAASLLFSCNKKDTSSSSSSSSSAPSTPATTASATSPATTEATAVDDDYRRFDRQPDPRDQPGVWLSINGQAEPTIPQGDPILIQATVLGGRDKPISFTASDLTLTLTAEGGADAKWPLKRAVVASTQPATAPVVTLMASDTAGASVSWVLPDSTAIPPGQYRVIPSLNGATPNEATITITPPAATQTAAQQTQRFFLTARASLLLGDPASALKQAESCLATSPNDVPALHIKGDALAAQGKRLEAAITYRKAITNFDLQNPTAKEPPELLLEALDRVSDPPKPARP